RGERARHDRERWGSDPRRPARRGHHPACGREGGAQATRSDAPPGEGHLGRGARAGRYRHQARRSLAANAGRLLTPGVPKPAAFRLLKASVQFKIEGSVRD
ncbi:hypothetical protein BFZC1_21907, partial [Lysinibacillus fusiformis ZC1]